MDDELVKLYDLLAREGYYTKSLESFKKRYDEDPSYRDKVYDVVSRDGFYTKSKEDFLNQYNPSVFAMVTEFLGEFNEGIADASKKKEDAILSGSSDGDSIYTEQVDADPFEGTFLSQERDPISFEERTAAITKDIIQQSEEFTVPQMNYNFNKFGFTFEESGAGNAMNVTSSNGQTLSVDLGWESDESSLAEAEKLKDFLNVNRVKSAALNDYTSQFSKQKGIIRSEEELKKAVTIFNDITKQYQADIDSWSDRAKEIRDEYDDKYFGLTEEQINADADLKAEYEIFKERDIALQREYADLVEREQYFKDQGKRLDRMVGNYVEMQSLQGNWGGGVWNSALSGMGSMAAAEMGFMIDFMVEYFPSFSMGDWQGQYIATAKRMGYEEYLPYGYEDMTVEELRKAMNISPEEIERNKTRAKEREEREAEYWRNYEGDTTNAIYIDAFDFGPPAVFMDETGVRSDMEYSWDTFLGIPVPTYRSPKTIGELIEDKAKDDVKKGTKFGEGYFRNPYSFVAANTDPEMGLVDATRVGARELFGDKETTEQWRDMQKESFWGGAILGLAESLPGMVGGNWAQRTANMYALTTDQLNQEMERNPDFDNISESEKYFVTAPVGVAVATLETFGLRNVINQKGLLNGVISRAIGRSTKSTSAKTFSQFIREDVESMMARGVLTVTAGGLAEFETGAAQQAAEITIKEIYNSAKDKDMFQTPNTWIEFAGEVLQGGAQEAVGGFVLATPGAIVNAVNNKEMSLIDDDSFNMLKDMSGDSEFSAMYGLNLRQKVSAGEMTQSEAKKKFDDFVRITAVTEQIPTDLNLEDQKKALELLVEKQELYEQISGRDKSLVKDKTDRVKEIDAELASMSERKNAAYLRDGRFLSRDEFIEQLEAATPEEIKEGSWKATNDSEVTDLLADKISATQQEAVVEEAPAEEAVTEEAVAEETVAEEPIAIEPAVEEEVVEEAPVTAEEVISGEAPIAEAPAEFSAEDQATISDINTEIRELSRQFGVAETVEEKQEARSKLVDARSRKAAIESKYLEDVSQEEAGVPSTQQEGQAVVEGEPIEEAGVEEVTADRDVQAPEEVTAEEAVTEDVPVEQPIAEEAPVEEAPVEEAVAEDPTRGRRRFPEEEMTYATEEEAIAAADALQERLSVEDPSLLVFSTETTGKRGKKTYGVDVSVNLAAVEEAAVAEEAAVEETVEAEPTKLVIEDVKIKPEEVVTQKDAEGNNRFFAAFPIKGRVAKSFFEVKMQKDGTIQRVSDKSYGPARKTLKRRLLAEAPTKPKSRTKQQLETRSIDAVSLSDKAPQMIESFNSALSSIGAAPVNVYVVNDADMQNVTGSSSRAQFRTLEDGTSAVIVNADKASLGSLSHEMMHAYIKALKLTPKQIVRFTNEIRSQLSKGNAQEKRLARELTEFQKEYLRREVYGKGLTLDDAIIAEEFLAEFVANIKDGIDVQKMSLSTIERIRKAVVRILNDILGLKIDDTAIKSKEEAFDFINGFLDALEGRVEPVKSQPVSKAAKVKGQTREQIEAIKIISDDTPKQKAKKDAVAEVLNGFAEDKLEPNSSEEDLISRFLNNIFEESLYTLKKGPRESGMTWYIEDITEFENKMTVLLPELANPNQMKLFKQVLAITSSGTNPNQNLQTAYTLWVRSNGDAVNFAKNWGEDKISFITKKGVAIGTGVIVRETKTKYIVQKVDALGNPEVFKDGTPKLFEAKKSNLKEGYPKPAGFTARGNIVAQQLTKIEKVYEAVGKDINKLIEFFEKPQPVSELRKYNKGVPDADGNVRKVAVGKRNGAFIFGEKIGAFYQNMIGIGDTITMDLWWSRTWNRYMGTMLSTVDGKQVIQETPRTDRERDVMRKAVTLAAKKLNLDVSELQAVIWYFEQELWTKAGNVSPSFSYVTAVEALNSKIKTDEQTQKRFSEAGADLTAAEKRRQDAIVRANNIIAEGGIQGAVKEQISEVEEYKGSKGETVRFQIEDQVKQEENAKETYSAIEDNKEGVLKSQIDNKVDQDVAASDTWKSRKRNVFERFVDLTRRKIQDSYRDIIVIQEDIEYATGKPVGLDQDFRNAEVLMHGAAKSELDKTENRIKDIAGKIKKSGLSVDEVNDLLYAMHAQERNRYLRTISTDIGKSLSEMRKKSGMTPTEVSELLGISKEQYLEVEANKRDLKSSDLTDLLLIYGSTPYRFFYDNALVKDGSGMTDVEARKILAKYDLNLTSPDVSQLSPKIRPAITAIRELIADTRNRLVESGLESQGTIDAFNATYKNYVPLRGFADEQFGSEIIEGGGKLEVRAKERRAKGRKRKADSPLTQAIISNTTTIIRGAKNDVMRKFYELAKNNPNKDIYEVVDPEKSKDYKTSLRDGKVVAVAKSVSDYLLDENMVSVRIDGDYKFIRFKDVKLADALRGANVTKAQWLTKYLGAFNRFQSALITTYDPGFVFRNFTRDIQTAVLNLYAEQDLDDGLIKDKDIVGKTIADVYPALKTIFAIEGGWTGKKEASRNKEMDQYYKEFLEDGAKTEWFYSKPADQINKDIEKLIRGKGDGARKAAASLVERLNSSVENAVRLSAYVNARKAGISRAKAAELAKNLTVNFNKSGEWGQVGNSLYLFFNASVQGSSRLLRTLKPSYKIDGEGNRKYHLTRAQKMVVGLYIMGSVMSVFNEWMSDDDEDGESFYSKIPDFEKERNIIIMKPNGRDYWKIPLPYGANTFYVAGSYTAEGLMGTKTPGEVASAIAQTAIGSFSPINFPTSEDASKFFIKFIMPTATQIPIAIGFNEDYFGQKIYRENFPFDPAPKPQSQLGKESGYRWTQAAAKWLNEVTGGSEYRSGYIDINPDKVDFIIESLTGGAGKFTTRSVNAIDKIMTGNWDQLESRQIPFVRIFNGQPYKYSNITQFYDRTVDVNQKFEEVKAGIIKGADAKKIYEMYKMGKAYKSRLKKISEAEDKAKNIEDPLKQENILDKLEKERYKLVANFNKRYIQLKIEDI